MAWVRCSSVCIALARLYELPQSEQLTSEGGERVQGVRGSVKCKRGGTQARYGRQVRTETFIAGLSRPESRRKKGMYEQGAWTRVSARTFAVLRVASAETRGKGAAAQRVPAPEGQEQ